MLTGLTAPTSGTALINGRDVGRDMAAIRNSLGVCPQVTTLLERVCVCVCLWVGMDRWGDGTGVMLTFLLSLRVPAQPFARPQHDVLWGDLTVEEHLSLFAAFKGMDAKAIPAAVEEMVREVGLTEKRKVASKNLSGGMKRKLSVGIAFIGGCVRVCLGVGDGGFGSSPRPTTHVVPYTHP